MKRPRSVLKIVAISIVLTAVGVPTLAVALWQVQHGRGAAVYTNLYGLAIHYTSVIFLVAAVILTLGVAYLARIVHHWRYGEATELRELDSQTPYTDPGDSNK
jgi:hypothetical protein